MLWRAPNYGARGAHFAIFIMFNMSMQITSCKPISDTCDAENIKILWKYLHEKKLKCLIK